MEKIKDFLNSLKDNQIAYQRIFLILEIVLYLITLFIWKSLLLPVVLVGVIALVYGFLSFCLVDYSIAQKQFKICLWTVGFFFCALVNSTLAASFPKFHKIFILMINILVFVGILIAMKSGDEDAKEIRKQKIEELLTKDIYATNKLGEKDTYMGKYLDTGEYNIVPYKDRFLHTLVLGVTGCGKTSQSLLPMVAKDVKCHELGVVCLDPKGDFAEQVYALAKLEKRDDVVYFNPTLRNCPYFNPMLGDIDSVSECLVTTFKKLENETQTFFANMDEMLMRRCIKVTKRVYGDSATLNHINILMNNPDGQGKEMLKKLTTAERDAMTGRPFDTLTSQENSEIASWFTSDYYTELDGGRNATKTYEQCSGVRNQVSKLLANSLIKKILCPEIKKEDMEPNEYLDFDRVLEKGGVLAMSSAQGELRELGTFIGFFLILSFESAVFRRPGDENTRRGVIFYVDEFQKYANDGYNDLLTMGRSYRVASVLATQTRAGISANSSAAEGKTLIETVSSNCRNKIIYPGCSYEDASYYSKEFGEFKKIKERVSYSSRRSLVGKMDVGSQNESVSTEEKMTPMFYPVEIMQRPFGQAIAQVVRNNTVQKPCAVKLNFIPKELKSEMDSYIDREIRPQHINYSMDDVEDEKVEFNKQADYKVSNPYGDGSQNQEEIEDLPTDDFDDNDDFGGMKDTLDDLI